MVFMQQTSYLACLDNLHSVEAMQGGCATRYSAHTIARNRVHYAFVSAFEDTDVDPGFALVKTPAKTPVDIRFVRHYGLTIELASSNV